MCAMAKHLMTSIRYCTTTQEMNTNTEKVVMAWSDYWESIKDNPALKENQHDGVSGSSSDEDETTCARPTIMVDESTFAFLKFKEPNSVSALAEMNMEMELQHDSVSGSDSEEERFLNSWL